MDSKSLKRGGATWYKKDFLKSADKLVYLRTNTLPETALHVSILRRFTEGLL